MPVAAVFVNQTRVVRIGTTPAGTVKARVCPVLVVICNVPPTDTSKALAVTARSTESLGVTGKPSGATSRAVRPVTIAT